MTCPVIVSVDTEEDNFGRRLRGPISVDNLRQLPRLAAFFQRFGIRCTYFSTYQALTVPWVASILRDLSATGVAEVGAHLHPWNTPPEDGANRSMLNTLAPEAQRAKLNRLTSAFVDALGIAPISFRAGRFGLGPGTVRALIASGYAVDSSVTPYFNWRRYQGGPNMIGAPNSAYRLDGNGDVRVPVPDGSIAEVPLSGGFTRFSEKLWPNIAGVLESRWAQALRLPSIAARGLGLRRSLLSPESSPLRDMERLTRLLLNGEVSHLHMFLHSPSLTPGLTPYTRGGSDVEALYARMEAYFERLSRCTTPRFSTVGEFGACVLANLGPSVLSNGSVRPAASRG